jgi:exopolysaccharide biosynthesis polyprenyl glycosylphosphotransferase
MTVVTSDPSQLQQDRQASASPPSHGEVTPRVVSYPRWVRRYVTALVGADLLAGLIAALISWAARPMTERQSVTVLAWRVDYWVLPLVVTPLWLGALALGGAYRRGHAGDRMRDYRLPVITALRLAGAASITAFAFHIALSRLVVVVYFPALLIASVVLRGVVRQGLSAIRKRGSALRRTLLVGDAPCVARFADFLARSPQRDYRVVGACVPGPASFVSLRARRLAVVGQPDDLVAAAQRVSADTVAIVGDPRLELTTLQEIAWRIERSGRDLLVAPDVVDLAGPRIRVGDVGGLPMLHIGDPLIGVRRQTVKAAYERLLGLVMLVILSPVFLAVAIAIWMDSGGPVFYRQERVGFKGRRFTMVKFRTMEQTAEAQQDQLRPDNEHDGALFKIRVDPRVTRTGRWLRRYSIDELPQLLNVIKGDMVLIGPRPVLPVEAESFGEAAQRRFLARPGMTGLWQVSGRADIPWEEAIRLDLYYVENWSPWMDFMIIWRTLGVLITGSGGY